MAHAAVHDEFAQSNLQQWHQQTFAQLVGGYSSLSVTSFVMSQPTSGSKQMPSLGVGLESWHESVPGLRAEPLHNGEHLALPFGNSLGNSD